MRYFIEFVTCVLIPVVIAAALFGLLFTTIYHIDKNICTAYGEKLSIETDYNYQCFVKDNGAWKLKPVPNVETEK